MTDDAPNISEIVGTRVKELRTDRGWSVRRFADECAAAGLAITPAQIENIEGVRRTRNDKPVSRREISVDELLALAWALGVAPVVLLFPADGDASYRITSDVETDVARAYRWLIGGMSPAVAVKVPDEHPGTHAARTSRYLAELAAYMTHPPETEVERLLRSIAEKVGVDTEEGARGTTDD